MTLPDLAFTPDLRARIAANLSGERRSAPGASLRAAAVSIVIAGTPGGPAHFLLTRRQARMNAHAGQFALPGGKIDPGETAEQAARREVQEELTLTLAGSELLGRLDDLPTRSGYLVTPFVFWLDTPREPVPNPGEVAHLHRIPLADLFAEDPGHPDEMGDDHGPEVFWLYIPTLGHRVYAPTAAMLRHFRDLGLTGQDIPAPHHAEPVFARK